MTPDQWKVGALAAEPSSVELGDYLGVVRRRYLVVGIALVVCVAFGLAYALTRPDVYRSRAQVALPTSGTPTLPAAQTAELQTELAVMTSDVVATRAAAIMPGDQDPRDMLSHLSTGPPTEARVITIVYTASDAETARAGAQAFADAYIEVKEEEQRQSVAARSETYEARIATTEQAILDAEAQIELLEPDSREARRAENARDRLEDTLADLRLGQAEVESEAIDGGTIITPARLPRKAQAQGLGRTIAASIAAGLALGLAAAFLLDRLDTRVRSAVDLQQATGEITLGSIPDFPERHRRPERSLITVHVPNGLQADAFRRLRTTVLLAMRDSGARTLAITSSVAGEGKSTVAANLSVALAQGGQQVLLISADLRRPGVDVIFDMPTVPGLSDILMGRASMDEATQKLGDLSIITRGAPVDSPTDLLGSDAAAKLIADASSRYDLIILDTPPVLAVADVLVLAPRLDATLLVVSLAAATTGQVRDAVSELGLAGANVLGTVLNNAGDRSTASAAAYGVT